MTTATPEMAFTELSETLLRERGVTAGKAFHSPGLKVDGRIFAMLVNDELVVKLPAERCAALTAAGAARPFESGSRTMREWAVIEQPSATLPELARDALSFVRGDYRQKIVLDAPVETVYRALTTGEGVAGWWAEGEVAGERGGRVRFDWAAGSYTEFRVEDATPLTSVEWHCVAQHDVNLPVADEWVATTLSFRLAREGRRTRLAFVHHGLAPALECHDACASGWDHFLLSSLKDLVETGRGSPF
jgi:uncharacterized protein YndB with AHSA1/START domain/TfoX/Sxy family transcriptional regulator of competence genes